MTITFNHTIVAAKDKKQSATFLTELFDLPSPEPFAHFLTVTVANDVSLDYAEVPDGQDIRPQHYAFLVSEDEFDSIYGKIRERGMQHWADPRGSPAGRDQPQRRRPRRLLPGPGGPLHGDPHPAVRVGRLSRDSSTATPSPTRRGSAFGRLPSTDTSSAARPSTTGPRSPWLHAASVARSRRPLRVPERGHERIRHGHLGVQHRDQGIRRDLRLPVECEDHVEFMRDVVAEKQARRKVAAQSPWCPAQPLEIVEQFGR